MEVEKGKRFYIRRQEDDNEHTGHDDHPKRPRRNGDGKSLRFFDERSEIAAYLVVVPGMDTRLFAPMHGEKRAFDAILLQTSERIPRAFFRCGTDCAEKLLPVNAAHNAQLS